MSHTEGKLYAPGEYGATLNGVAVFRADMPSMKGSRAEANAQRLVKCWNEHDDLVRDNTRLYESLNSEMRARLEAEKERDELVKALRDLFLNGYSATRIEKVGDLLSKYPEPS
jgi:hypothetical protein